MARGDIPAGYQQGSFKLSTGDKIGLGALGLGALGSWWSARSMRKEAEKDRAFQERMSNTAHQREAADMRAAGFNPMFAFGGASSPGGSKADVPDWGRGVSDAVASALAVRHAKAQIDLTRAQTDETNARAVKTNQEAEQFFSMRSGQLRLQDLSISEKEQLLPLAVARARQEIKNLESSARKIEAEALLAQLAKTGAMNTEAFERAVGTKGRWTKAVVEIIRSLK